MKALHAHKRTASFRPVAGLLSRNMAKYIMELSMLLPSCSRPAAALHLPPSGCSTSYAACASSAPLPARRRLVAARAQLFSRPCEPEVTHVRNEGAAPAPAKARVEESILYHSTLREQAWVWGTLGLLGANLAVTAPQLHSVWDCAAAASAVIFAYFLSDFLTGVYHWSVDNYGDGQTPIVGSQIAAFQGHHQEPWTITQREFCNNVHKVFMPAFPFAALCLAATPLLTPTLQIGLSVATALTCMSQQFHAWAHTKASRLPAPVRAMQDAGLLVSRRAHGAHHKAPFEGNYCIVSGVWNDLLDKTRFFRKLEDFVYARTGVEPRCWHEPNYSWQEC